MLKLQRTRYLHPSGPLPVQMANSDATALRLMKQDSFGADLIRFPAGGSVVDHTHEGDHMLFVISGHGWIDYDEEPYELFTGDCYLVLGSTRHGIRADTELTLIAIANKHIDAALEGRLHVTSL